MDSSQPPRKARGDLNFSQNRNSTREEVLKGEDTIKVETNYYLETAYRENLSIRENLSFIVKNKLEQLKLFLE